MILFTKILPGEEVPSNEKGIIFAGTGKFSWKEFSEHIGETLFKQGAISIKVARSITLEEGKELFGGDIEIAEVGFTSK